MANKYRTIGTLGNMVRVRTQRTWIITFPDGEKVKFNNLRLAIMGTKAALGMGKNVKLEEKTLLRYNKFGKVKDEEFCIDMTERVKLMASIESKLKTV